MDSTCAADGGGLDRIRAPASGWAGDERADHLAFKSVYAEFDFLISAARADGNLQRHALHARAEIDGRIFDPVAGIEITQAAVAFLGGAGLARQGKGIDASGGADTTGRRRGRRLR